ncbi:ferredoxin reductase family protein [Pseudovibrio axinellae]|nr:ferredoxin reductase family protein [Pseudovibrio axinellae]
MPSRLNGASIFGTGRKTQLAMGYLSLLILPYAATYMLGMDNKGWYGAILALINSIAMMAFFIQFPLGSRIKAIGLFANIDWSMTRHRQVGKWLGYIFFLHPFLILAPRFFVSFDVGMTSAYELLTAPQSLTGVVAWGIMVLWILTSIFKNKLPIKYETWRFTHMLGFVVIATLATLHITGVGRHGQFQPMFNVLWLFLCSGSLAMVGYNYLLKPRKLKSRPFKLANIKKVSSSDWELTLEKSDDAKFDFEAGQFAWINTSGSAHGVNEHPFSIASCRENLPYLSFLIRELGDYTSKLGDLTIGQDVYVDGPYGSVSLRCCERAKGIVLIAGGAGIGPMLGMLRKLAARNDQRPIRLIYGNNQFEQMVCQDEITALEQTMSDFCQQLVCAQATEQPGVYQGFIDRVSIQQNLESHEIEDWCFYLCGPQPMVNAVCGHLKGLQVRDKHVNFEQLSF